MQETVPEEENTKVMTKSSIVVYPAIEKIGDLKEEAEAFLPRTIFNLSSDSEVRRKGSLDDNDLGHSKSTVPKPVAHDRALPEHSTLVERLQSKTVLEAAATSGQLPFEGQQPSLGS